MDSRVFVTVRFTVLNNLFAVSLSALFRYVIMMVMVCSLRNGLAIDSDTVLRPSPSSAIK